MKHLKVIFCLQFTLMSVLLVKSQEHAKYWYFGDHAGLKFVNGNPIPAGGQTYFVDGDSHNEGTSVISDSEGNLLMYSNGEKLWNSEHDVMPNGDSLMGGASASHAAFIVPKPGSDQLFYLFTTEDFLSIDDFESNGFRYSVVDMCLDNGKGDIVSGEKNVLLLTPVAEKIAVTRHANGVDYWVVVHEYYTDRFFSYLLTENGIMDPVISTIGSVHVGSIGNPTHCAIGQMKLSPDGSKIALCITNPPNQIIELFDFSNSTGVVSDFTSIPLDILKITPYGIEFSPDNSKLYVGRTDRQIFQYDLANEDAQSIVDSVTLVFDEYANWAPAVLGFQLAPNGKIYVARFNCNYLSEISAPNQPGMDCQFADSTVFLGNNGMCSYSLPSFIPDFDYDNETVICESEVEEKNSELDIIIYPNPNDGVFKISANPGLSVSAVHLYNSMGQLVYSNRLNFFGGNPTTLDVRFLPEGSYTVALEGINGRMQRMFFKGQ